MFKRILVSLDGTPRDTEALAVAEHLAESTGAMLLLARFVPLDATPEQVTNIRMQLRKEVSHVWSKGIEADLILEHGEGVPTMAYAVRRHHADLVLIVPERRDALELLWYPRSSVLELAALPAPLLIWPEGATHTDLFHDPDACVLVPLDGSDESERALPFGIAIADGFRRNLVLARVMPMTYHAAGAPQRPGPVESDPYLASVKERLSLIGIENVKVVSTTGPVSQELLHTVEDVHADLIVMTAHAQSGPARFFAGCVATNLLRRAEVPVLLIPREAILAFGPAIREEIFVLNLQR